MAAGRVVLSQYFPAYDRNARLVSGAKLYVYLNGTTTKATIYSDEAMTTPQANPVEANSSGQFPAIWASDATTYTLSITGPDGGSIGNPSVFDDYSVSTLANTESVALAEAAATAAEEALADVLAVQATGDDAAAIAARVPKNTDGSDFSQPTAVLSALGGAAKAQNLNDLADKAAATNNLLFLQSGTGAVSRSLRAKVRDLPLNPKDFGAVADGTLANAAADTAAFKAMAAYALENKRPILCPPGLYRLQDNILFDGEVVLRGAGAGGGFGAGRDGTVFINDITNDAAQSKPLIDFEMPSNKSAVTPILEGFKITTLGSYGAGYARKWMGLNWSAVNGTVITNGAVRNVVIENHSIGVDINGVIYQCAFDNVRVSGSPVDVSVDGGIPLGPDIAGFRIGIRSAIDITYNSFRLCEATGVRNGGYGWRGGSNYSDFHAITADGPIDLSSRAGNAIGVTVEGWTQDAGASPTTYAMGFTGFATVLGPTFRGLPVGKFGTGTGEIVIGLFIGGDGAIVAGLRTSDGVIPPTPVYNDGVNTFIGCLESGDVVTNKMAATGAGGLQGSLAINCDALTDYGFGVSEGTWTPSFSADFTTTPTVISATWYRIGRQVTVSLYCTDGVLTAGGYIAGLPFTCAAGTAFAASGSNNDTTEKLSGSIVGGQSQIGNIPAATLTGNFWQLTGTYLV